MTKLLFGDGAVSMREFIGSAMCILEGFDDSSAQDFRAAF